MFTGVKTIITIYSLGPYICVTSYYDSISNGAVFFVYPQRVHVLAGESGSSAKVCVLRQNT